VSSISIEGAAEVLLPPEPGLAYLRHDRAGRQRTAPGSVTSRDGAIAALDDDEAADVRIDARGCAVVPGLVDCHTHLPFVGWRADEYAKRVAGVPYLEIARAGGGIRRSARLLAEASDEEVLEHSADLADEMLRLGTTAFECKTGYGLSADAERRSLRLAGDLSARVRGQRVVSTALLGHAVPDGHTPDSWMAEVEALVPALVRGGARDRVGGELVALDIYVESIAFTNDHLRRMAALARRCGLHMRAHVEQFASHASVPVAVEAGARSVDHLSCMPHEHLPALAASETAAVLLPAAEFLGRERTPLARELADAGAICALATDLNPGTSPVASMPLVIGLAVRMYGWTAPEALLAATLNAAWVLGLSGELGSIEVGKRGDLVVLEGPIESVPYRLGHDPVVAVIAAGELVHVSPGAGWRVTS
jgi:imidazolonepropionase